VHDEHKSDDARGNGFERPALERSGGGRPDESATRYGNAAGDDVAGANFRS
jgi:hypothetical protein